jgi:predicted ABC-type ATPase
MKTPRLRIFAGPNGSGKSTLKSVINKKLLGVYINPDDIEKEIFENRFLKLMDFEVNAHKTEVIEFFINHPLIQKADLKIEVHNIDYDDGKINFSNININSYYASICADFIRQKLIERNISFTFETVMSSKDKVDLLKKAQDNGYKTYLYYIATQDPLINITRVQNRVLNGGHNVPKEKIVQRYFRSLELLIEAIKYTNRTYIFDNSTSKKRWLAQIDDNHILELKTETIPKWLYNYLLNKIEKNKGQA